MSERWSGAQNCATVFERVASRYAERVAIVDDGRTLSYAQLQSVVDHRAAALDAAGVMAGDRVALVAETSADFLAAALAVWRCSAVLVTVYPSSSADDLAYALGFSDPCLVVVDAGIDRAVIASACPQVPVVDLASFAPSATRRGTIGNPQTREPLALICFSSGTTSRPKAIMLSHSTIANCAATYAEVWHLTELDRGIVALPMAWLYGLASTSLALLFSGATVITIRRARPELLWEAMTHLGATFIAGVTATYVKLVRFLEDSGADSSGARALRLCISGGEPRNEAMFDRWANMVGVAVLDAYCASECLPLVTYDPTVDLRPRRGSAGKLVPRALLRIVDEHGADVAPGAIGEGLSSGPGLMLGYWRDPELTAATITPDGWYRTRDLLRVDGDGYVFVEGRMSDLIIRGGVNISPTEVEVAIWRTGLVEDVAVVGLPDETYGERVVAAIVARPDLDVSRLDDAVRAVLSGYKVPSEYVRVESLAVNSTTGKVSRRDVAAALERPPGWARRPADGMNREVEHR